ncbi:hypothetical protein [Francisella philomiragia]|uniref:Uncharacterized protein n=1 Tax=Francisella philomiragia TaxID=28110 RepID=A0A0B6CUG1_9GAMM|nr:hypothetical protein [Francisella philomiragia]AJI54144.1 hypothetical protein LA55_1230 [Francisella philomiragia]
MLNRKQYSTSVDAFISKIAAIHPSINVDKEIDEIDSLNVPSVIYYLNSIEPEQANTKLKVNFSLLVINDSSDELGDLSALLVTKLHEEYFETQGLSEPVIINQAARYPLNSKNESLQAMIIDGEYLLIPYKEDLES